VVAAANARIFDAMFSAIGSGADVDGRWLRKVIMRVQNCSVASALQLPRRARGLADR